MPSDMQLYALNTFQAVSSVFITSLILVFFATLAVALRLWARRSRKIALWVDDYLIICSLLLLYVLLAIEIADARYGMRLHVQKIPMENLSLMLKMLIAYQLVYGTTLALSKASCLFFYRRIFVSKPFIKATWILLGTVMAWYIANVLQVFLICRPFSSNWDLGVKAVCGNRPAAYTVIGAINMVTDVLIMVLPVHFIRRLQMPTSAKIGVSLIFMIGLLICAISIVRMIVLARLDFNDISYNMLDSVFWTVVEPSLFIINACFPTFRPVFSSAVTTFWHKASSPGRQIQLDEYPLTDKRNVSHTAEITAHHKSDPDSEALCHGQASQAESSINSAGDGKLGEGVVYVRKEWKVLSRG